jgi:hypothetical protein
MILTLVGWGLFFLMVMMLWLGLRIAWLAFNLYLSVELVLVPGRGHRDERVLQRPLPIHVRDFPSALMVTEHVSPASCIHDVTSVSLNMWRRGALSAS